MIPVVLKLHTYIRRDNFLLISGIPTFSTTFSVILVILEIRANPLRKINFIGLGAFQLLEVSLSQGLRS